MFRWQKFANLSQSIAQVRECPRDWEQRFQELQSYKHTVGNCNVRQAENPQLAKWVRTQRYEKKKLDEGKATAMTPERMVRLDSLGFIWQVLRAR